MMRLSIFTFLLLCGLNLSAQIGGLGVYRFLSLTNSAHVAAMGGTQISLPTVDPAMAFHNPSLLNDSMDNHLVLNYVNYFTDIHYGYFSYTRSVSGLATFSGGIHHIDYGKFTRTDESGQVNGTFSAGEYALNLMASRQIDSSFRVGVNLKPVYSALESYKSFGMVADAGITYLNPERRLLVAFVVKNAGFQIKPYYEGHREKIDADIQLGFTKKLKHAPLRFSLTLHHLDRWDLTYENPEDPSETTDLLTGETNKKSWFAKNGDIVGRHAVLGAELMLSKSFYIALGYNYQRRAEMKVESRPFMVGTSWGFGFRINRFHFAYARASYHLAGASNHFSVTTDLSKTYRKAAEMY